MSVRITAALVEYHVTELTGDLEIANEQPWGEPRRLFRVVHPDIWAHADRLIAATPLPAPQFASNTIRSAVVRYLLTEFDDTMSPQREFLSQPVRVFRAGQPDIWAHGDELAFP